MIHSIPAARADEAGAQADTTARFLRDAPLPFARVMSSCAVCRPVALVREGVHDAASTGRRPPDLSAHLTPALPRLVF